MPAFWKKKQFWGSIIAIVLLAYCVEDISISQIKVMYQSVNFYFLIPSLGFSFGMIIFRAVRWRVIIEKTKKVGLIRIISLYSAGQVVNISMPALTGQVGRLLLFAKKESLSKTYVFSTIVLEVVFDAVTMFLFIIFLSTASFAFPPEYRSVSIILAIGTGILIILLYILLHFEKQIGVLGKKILRGRWPGVYITLKRFSKSFTKGISLLRSTQYFFRTFMFSVASWVAHALLIYFLFTSFGFNLPIIAAIVVMVLNTLALMIPITPGNVGTFELVVVAALLAYGIPKSDAVLFAMALHILDLIPIFIMGLFFLRSEKVNLKEIHEQGAKEEILDRVDDLVTEEQKT